MSSSFSFLFSDSYSCLVLVLVCRFQVPLSHMAFQFLANATMQGGSSVVRKMWKKGAFDAFLRGVIAGGGPSAHIAEEGVQMLLSAEYGGRPEDALLKHGTGRMTCLLVSKAIERTGDARCRAALQRAAATVASLMSAGGKGKLRACPVCSVTETDEAPFMVCSRCKIIVYCSRPCQAKHWKAHKQECKKNTEARQEGKSQTVPSNARYMMINTWLSRHRLPLFAAAEVLGLTDGPLSPGNLAQQLQRVVVVLDFRVPNAVTGELPGEAILTTLDRLASNNPVLVDGWNDTDRGNCVATLQEKHAAGESLIRDGQLQLLMVGRFADSILSMRMITKPDDMAAQERLTILHPLFEAAKREVASGGFEHALAVCGGPS